jgi:hypothetical protein
MWVESMKTTLLFKMFSPTNPLLLMSYVENVNSNNKIQLSSWVSKDLLSYISES